MLQRLVGVTLGALLTVAILWTCDFTNQVDRMPWYVAAAVAGAVVGFVWPAIASLWFGQRAKDHREAGIDREVQRKLAEERSRKVE